MEKRVPKSFYHRAKGTCVVPANTRSQCHDLGTPRRSNGLRAQAEADSPSLLIMESSSFR